MSAVFHLLLVAAVAALPQQGAPAAEPQARVITGANSSDQPIVSLAQLTADHDWLALENALRNSQDQDSHDPDAEFYRGLLENREAHYRESIRILEPLLPGISASADRNREKLARLTLADDYFRTFAYKQAADAYAALQNCCATLLTAAEKNEVELPTQLLPVFASAPPQTLDLASSFTVPTETDALGLSDVSVWVDGLPTRWLFDPAQNFTLLSRSQAKLVGLKLSAETFIVSSITGKPIPVHATVIPRLKFGAATFHNVPAVVFDDLDLYDKAHQYQIEGVLAQPLLAPLGQITASDDQHLTFSEAPPLAEGAPFFSDGVHLIVAAGKQGAERLYTINPGDTGSLLSSRYYDAHLAAFAHTHMDLVELAGEPQTLPIPAYHAETVDLTFGGTPITLHEIEVLAQPAGAERDRFYGVLGADALEQLQSYTFDFRSMKFIVRPHAGQ
jgi:Aspartyl protease